ncbi:MAG: transporter substrate-binding domain-containing protein [Bacteroidales bacterium]|nr:transporter substrate-binding domain-containing protein [Bacteroidales bacterium]
MTRTNRISLLIILSGLLAVFSGCNKNQENETYWFSLDIMTESYPPFNYAGAQGVTGLSGELLKVICSRMNIPFNVDILPWSEAYTLAQGTANAMLFSTVLNDERKDLFKWAGPIASLDWYFYASADHPIPLTSLDEAKQIERIGVVPDYAITQYLEQSGFQNLVYCTDQATALEMLLGGEIDLFPSDQYAAQQALESLGKTIFAVIPEITIRTEMIYFAFNRQVPDEVVSDFQRQIDQAKNDGTLKSLYEQYLNSSDFPGILQIYTEQYPPLTFRNNFGEITGFGTDVVKEIMQRNHVFSNITLTIWSIGYDLALVNPNFCLFTMDRTALRDTLFQWVGPLGTNATYFYTKAGSGIIITSLEEAKNLTAVGTVTSWFSDQYLRELGFTNLVSDPDPQVMTEKLFQGEIDAFVCSCVTFPEILSGLGYSYSDAVPEYILMSSDYYIAFSKNSSPLLVGQWQTALDDMKTDGTYNAIYHRWFP